MLDSQDLQIIIYSLGVVCFVLFIFSVLVGFAIIRIEKHFKDLVDLQYKKYEEEHGKDKDVSIDKS